VKVEVTEDGRTNRRYNYNPYGELIAADPRIDLPVDNVPGTRQRYAGMYDDEASGLDHTLWRKYESSLGRRTSPDPSTESMSIGDPQSFNRYSYVGNDPVNRIDPIFTIIEIKSRPTSYADTSWSSSACSGR
jgi:RHS repeat-associated protein